MKAILINVKDRTVTEVNHSGDYKEIYKLLEIETPFAVAYERANGDGVYIDDEGLLHPAFGAFVMSEFSQPLAGHGLILGVDEVGETVDCESTVDEIRRIVKFVPVELLRGIPTAPVIIPLDNEEMSEYFKTGKLPLGKRPTNPN